jgi:hypothetical protein
LHGTQLDVSANRSKLDITKLLWSPGSAAAQLLGATTMAKVPAFHSTRLGETVHHNNNACTEGNNIEKKYYATGTGGRPLCNHCARLS